MHRICAAQKNLRWAFAVEQMHEDGPARLRVIDDNGGIVVFARESGDNEWTCSTHELNICEIENRKMIATWSATSEGFEWTYGDGSDLDKYTRESGRYKGVTLKARLTRFKEQENAEADDRARLISGLDN